MKKAIALILSLVMCVSLFTACGKQQGGTDDQETAKTLVVGTQTVSYTHLGIPGSASGPRPTRCCR